MFQSFMNEHCICYNHACVIGTLKCFIHFTTLHIASTTMQQYKMTQDRYKIGQGFMLCVRTNDTISSYITFLFEMHYSQSIMM